MRIWLDDERPMPEGFDKHCRTYKEITDILFFYWREGWEVEEISLDNDLGEGEVEGRKVVLWLAEKGHFWDESVWPKQVTIHSANPVARDYMLGMIERYKPVE